MTTIFQNMSIQSIDNRFTGGIIGGSQKRHLKKLLRTAEDTMFGSHYDFYSILNSSDPVKAFQKNVPIHNYEEIYEKWWSKSLEGATDVAWKGGIKYFALSSGTSNDSSKYIPVSEDMQRSMKKGAVKIARSIRRFGVPYHVFFKEWLTIGGSASLSRIQNSLVGDLSGINSLDTPMWVRPFKKPGLEIAQLKTWQERTEAIVKHAPEWDISTLVGIPSWVQLTLEKVIEHHNLNNIHELWPNLSLFVTGGINFEPYRSSFRELLGREIAYMDTYLASEGFFAIQQTPEDTAMTLITDGGIFYEFIPFNAVNFDEMGKLSADAPVLTLDEVKNGQEYAIVVSTCAGAWRYLLGDTVLFTDVSNNKIRITGRIGQFLSVCGEHLSINNLNTAIAQVCQKHGINIKEFTVGATPCDGHFRHEWYLSHDSQLSEETIAQLIDDELMILNDDYKAERGAMLRKPVVHVVPHDLFLDWINDRGKMNGQSKVPKVFSREKLEGWQKYVAAYGTL